MDREDTRAETRDARDPGDATRLLQEAAAGREDAAERLLPLVYDELRSIAGACFSGERSGHTLQPTAVVHEAWLRLFGSEQPSYADRTHFLAVAATVMRRVLVDHARTRGREKRGGDWARITLDDSAPPARETPELEARVLDLHQALEELARVSPRQANVVELRWFGGLSQAEIAGHLGVTERTVSRDWTMAKAWVRRHLDHCHP